MKEKWILTIYYCIKIGSVENENLIMINEILDIGGGILQCLTTKILDSGEFAFESETSTCCLC